MHLVAALDHARGVTLGQVAAAADHSKVRTASGPQNLAALRTPGINALRLTGHTNVAAGLRKHARTPVLPLTTLGLT